MPSGNSMNVFATLGGFYESLQKCHKRTRSYRSVTREAGLMLDCGRHMTNTFQIAYPCFLELCVGGDTRSIHPSYEEPRGKLL